MIVDIGPVEEWFVAFKTKAKMRIANLFPGRFKHVMAFASRDGLWAFCDVAPFASQFIIVPDPLADPMIANAIADATVLKVVAGPGRLGGLWCVPATANLTGVPSCALRPDAFFRDCLAHGAEILIENSNGRPFDDGIRRQDFGAEERRARPGGGTGAG
jgi:hypothetical protein